MGPALQEGHNTGGVSFTISRWQECAYQLSCNIGPNDLYKIAFLFQQPAAILLPKYHDGWATQDIGLPYLAILGRPLLPEITAGTRDRLNGCKDTSQPRAIMQYESCALFTGDAPVHCRRSWEAYPNVSPWLRSCKVSPINGSPRLPSGRGRDVTGACTCPDNNKTSGMPSWPNQRERERYTCCFVALSFEENARYFL